MRAFPAAAGLVQCQQLDRSQPDPGGLGADEVVAGGQRRGGQGGGDPVGEASRASRGGRRGRTRSVPRGRPAASSGWVGQRSSSRNTVGAPRSRTGHHERGRVSGLQVRAQPVEQPTLVAGGAFVVAGDRAQFPPSSPCGISVLSPACRSSASRQQIRASSASSFFRAGPRRRATRSGLTGTTVNPASSNAATSSPWRVSSTTRTSAGSGSNARQRPTSRSTPAGPWSMRNCSTTPLSGVPRATSWNSSAQSMPTPST